MLLVVYKCVDGFAAVDLRRVSSGVSYIHLVFGRYKKKHWLFLCLKINSCVVSGVVLPLEVLIPML